MHLLCDLCLIPQVDDLSLSPYVAECQKVFAELGLTYQLHAWGTNIEGDWDTVMEAVKRCHQRVHDMGAVRISSTLKLGTRTDREDNLAGKVERVQNILQDGV